MGRSSWESKGTPQRNNALIRPYEGKPMGFHSPLIRPAISWWGGGVGGIGGIPFQRSKWDLVSKIDCKAMSLPVGDSRTGGMSGTGLLGSMVMGYFTYIYMGYIGGITHLLTIDPNFLGPLIFFERDVSG